MNTTADESQEKRSIASFKLNVVDASHADKRLRGAPILVLQRIAIHLNKKTRDTYVSQDVLAAETGYSRQSVINACDTLKKTGWLRVQIASHGGNLYSINETSVDQYLAIVQQRKGEGQASARQRSNEAYRRKCARSRLPRECGQSDLTI